MFNKSNIFLVVSFLSSLFFTQTNSSPKEIAFRNRLRTHPFYRILLARELCPNKVAIVNVPNYNNNLEEQKLLIFKETGNQIHQKHLFDLARNNLRSYFYMLSSLTGNHAFSNYYDINMY